MKDGGHAFPCMTGPNSAEVGMTLRDYFAAQVLPTIIWFDKGTTNPSEHILVNARIAYRYADAMLAEREAT